MSPTSMRNVIGIIIFVHGIGHFQGVMSSLGLFNNDVWNPKSWLFDKLLGDRNSRYLALVLWGLSVLGFMAAGFAFLGIGIPHETWRTLMIMAAIPSSLGIIFYWNSLSRILNKLGAIGVNAWILIGLLLMNWPSEAALGF